MAEAGLSHLPRVSHFLPASLPLLAPHSLEQEVLVDKRSESLETGCADPTRIAPWPRTGEESPQALHGSGNAPLKMAVKLAASLASAPAQPPRLLGQLGPW